MHKYPRRYNRDVIDALLEKHPEGENRLLKVCQEYEESTGDRLERAPLMDLIRRGVVGESRLEERPPRRYLIPSIVEALLLEDPWLLLHPGDLYRAYRLKTITPCSDYALRKWLREHGIEVAQASPHYEPDLLDQIPPRVLKKMVVPKPLKQDSPSA